MESHRCSFAAKFFDEARKSAEERCTGRTEEEVQEEIRKSLKEVARRITQGRIGANMPSRRDRTISRGDRRETEHVRRGRRSVCRYSWKEQDQIARDVLNTEKLCKETNVITLTGLRIFPKVGERGVGTLEVHVNGFYYRTSTPDFCFSFLWADVKQAFFRIGDEKMPPLLHFHLYHCVKVGTEKRRNIQFRLVQNVAGQKRSYSDSDNIHDSNKDLKHFVDSVREKWRYIPVVHCCAFVQGEVCKADEFQGNRPSKAPTVFGMTFTALVGLVDEPFVMLELKDIKIVNLRLKPVEIHMTIVFHDFKREPVEINSIPIDKLNLIKDRCNYAGVKYYVNDYDIDQWSLFVKLMADYTAGRSPDWFQLESPETKPFYEHTAYRGSGGEAYCRSDEEGEKRDRRYRERD
ncbi:hypothetical protein MKW94_010715 [Papaver nudicaule]|uniref:FACT complex subunit n=1 Tax=Papaver nudicaule TaxID=74823 RepID=A0AA41W193_PAPNU|nr:hypothetical protein [Papaver nudicaule]